MSPPSCTATPAPVNKNINYQGLTPTSRIPVQFEEEADALGIDVSVEAFSEVTPNRHHPSIEAIVAAQPRPTAVFAIDDDYARALIARLLYAGIRVPRDVSVFSGSTAPTPDGLLPALTGLVVKYGEQLQVMCDRFVDIIEDGGKESEIVLPRLEVELVERESCASPPDDEN